MSADLPPIDPHVPTYPYHKNKNNNNNQPSYNGHSRPPPSFDAAGSNSRAHDRPNITTSGNNSHGSSNKNTNSNTYGFDFLRSEHRSGATDDTDDAPPVVGWSGSSSETASRATDVRNKSDLEKQFDVLAFLQAHRGSGCLAPPVIAKATGIHLDTLDATVGQMLQRNPKVRVEMVPDPENPALMVAHYAYQAKYTNVLNKTSLLAQINRMIHGVPMRDLLDSYATVTDDLQALITAGEVMALPNPEDKDKILFPRGEVFGVELDGIVSLPPSALAYFSSSSAPTINGVHASNVPLTATSSSTAKAKSTSDPPTSTRPRPTVYTIETDMDPCTQIRRGEAIQVGGQWFRVSSAVREGVPLSEQPARAQAPLSVVSLTDLSKRNEVDGYIRALDTKHIPLDAALSETAQRNLWAAKQARERLAKLAHGRGGGGVTGQLLGSPAHASNPTTLATSLATSASSSSSSTLLHHHHHHQNSAATTATSSNSTAAGGSRRRPQAANRTATMAHAAALTAASSSASVKVFPDDGANSSTAAAAGEGRVAWSKDALQKAAADPALALYGHARRHGCTRDVRDMYLETRSLVPESDADLQALLIQHKLMEPGEQMRRPRLTRTGANVDNDGKPKKRRYYERKNQRMTNTHLEGTEIGAVLARAAEQQKQGKSVGDGGM